MNLSSSIEQQLTHERYNARQAQNFAHIISFGPVIFQTARLMIKYGIFEMLRSYSDGLTEDEIATQAGLSKYAAKCLLEASLTIGTVIIDNQTDRYRLS